MSYGATLAWLLFVITLVMTLVSVPDLGAGSTTRGSASMSALHRAGARRGRLVRGPAPTAPDGRDAAARFAVTFVLVVLLAAFLSPLLRAVMTSLKIVRPADPGTLADLARRHP